MMSRQRFDILFDGMTAIAQRVYHAVPIEEKWTQQEVCSELRRLGSNVDFRTVAGCLNTLLRAGLIKEPSPACFRREKIREVAEKPPEIPVFTKQSEVKLITKPPLPETGSLSATISIPERPPAAGKPTLAIPGKTPLERLAGLADQMAVMAGMLTDVAKQVEELALDVQADFDKNDQDLEKMRQLQMMMKNFVQQ